MSDAFFFREPRSRVSVKYSRRFTVNHKVILIDRSSFDGDEVAFYAK